MESGFTTTIKRSVNIIWRRADAKRQRRSWNGIMQQILLVIGIIAWLVLINFS